MLVIINDQTLDHSNDKTVLQSIVQIVKQGHPHLIIDLSNIRMISSLGLAVLTNILRECNAHNGSLKVIKVPKDVEEMIKLTQLDRIISIYANLEDALNQ